MKAVSALLRIPASRYIQGKVENLRNWQKQNSHIKMHAVILIFHNGMTRISDLSGIDFEKTKCSNWWKSVQKKGVEGKSAHHEKSQRLKKTGK